MNNNHEEEDMQKWEYSVGYWCHKNGYTWGGKNIEKSSEMLNYAGNQGWELVSTGLFIATNFSDTFTDYIYFYFKRPKPSDEMAISSSGIKENIIS